MLNTLLEDLLDLAKQEQLTFQLNKSYFNLMDAVQTVFKNLDFLAMKKEITLDLVVSRRTKQVFEKIYGD